MLWARDADPRCAAIPQHLAAPSDQERHSRSGAASSGATVYIDDATDAFLSAALTPATEGLALNVGGDAPYILAEIAETLIRANNGVERYEIREFPAERKRIDLGDFLTDDRRFRELAGWQPRVSLADGLARSLDYYRKHLGSYV